MATEKIEAPATADAGEKTAEAVPSSGGIKGWLPLIITAVTMPALAYCTTAFVLIPRLQKQAAVAASSSQTDTNNSSAAAAAADSKPATPAKAEEKGAEKGKESTVTDATLKDRGVKVTRSGKMTVPLTKILVNVAGSMGSRYLMAGVTLASDKQGFGDLIINNEAQLLDAAASVLSSKSIADLEKPEARTVVRSELQTVFNNALGSGTVQEVYLTEFAIQ